MRSVRDITALRRQAARRVEVRQWTATPAAVWNNDHMEISMAYPAPYTSQVTVPLPSDEAFARIAGDAFDPAMTLDVFKMFSGTEEMWEGIIGLVTAVFKDPSHGVEEKTRELIVLRTAKLLNAPYGWITDVKMATNAGLSAGEIEAAASDGPVTGISPELVLACKAVDELTMSGTLRDETLSELLQEHGDKNFRKIIFVISFFNLVMRYVNGCRVPLEVTDKVETRTSPLH